MTQTVFLTIFGLICMLLGASIHMAAMPHRGRRVPARPPWWRRWADQARDWLYRAGPDDDDDEDRGGPGPVDSGSGETSVISAGPAATQDALDRLAAGFSAPPWPGRARDVRPGAAGSAPAPWPGRTNTWLPATQHEHVQRLLAACPAPARGVFRAPLLSNGGWDATHVPVDVPAFGVVRPLRLLTEGLT